MLKSGIAPLASQEDLEDMVSPGASLLELDPLMNHNSTSSIPDASAFKIDGQDGRSSATMLKADLALRASQKDLEEVISMHPDTSTEEQQPLMQRCGSSSSINESATEADSQDDRNAVDYDWTEDLTAVLATLQYIQSRIDTNAVDYDWTEDLTAVVATLQDIQSRIDTEDCFMPTLNILKEMLKVERTEWEREEPRRVVKLLLELLIQLEKAVENPSTMDQDMIPKEKLKHLMELWNGMPYFDRAYMTIYLFVIHSQLRRATMTMRVPEEISCLTSQIQIVVMMLFLLLKIKRTPHDLVLSLQKIRGNSLWRFNHLDEYRKRITEEGVGRMKKLFNEIYADLMWLNNLLLSSSIEQMVVRWPSLEHYAQGRVSNPVHLCRGNSEADIHSLLTKVISSSSPLSIKWLHLALSEMLSEQQEWADIVSSRVISRNGDDSADVDMESIIMKALRTTSSLLGLGTEPSVMDANDGDETCSMFHIEYLDEEKFTDTGFKNWIRAINQRVSLNRSLLRLRWSLDKSIKDYVQASESEEGAERATQCQEANITFGDYIGMFQKKTENRLLQLGEAEFKRLMSIEGLLFDVEKDMLKDMGQDQIIENMSRVALIVPGDEEVEISNMIPYNADNKVLERAINAHMRSKKKDLQARKFEVLLLMLFPFLYLSDVITDCYVAYKHCHEANYLYFGLTLVFIFGPMLADLIGIMFWKWRGAWKTWKAVFSRLESLKLLPRALRSVNFAIKSRRTYDRNLCVLYEELHRARGGLPMESSENLRQSHMSLINAHFFAAMVKNEQWQLSWKLNEALNESAPQLLLQLFIAIEQLGNGETVGLLTYIGILASLASFAWTLHLFHYVQHYDGLVNNLKWFHRLTDFVAHFLIVGCRFIAISIVMALFPGWFSLAALFYFGFLFLYLYKYSSDRDDYRWLTKESGNTLWMVYRLFITPYHLRIWCIDTYDDILYNFETFVLALSWPFLLDGGHPLADYRWIITATILILNFIILPFILKLNERMFEESLYCEDHDPFPLRKRLWKDLNAGITRVGSLFRRCWGA